MIWRVLAGLVVWWYAMDAAILYGGIWEARANPTENVEVVLTNDLRLKGTLTRDWQRSWVLVTDDGSEVRFTDFRMMAFQRPEEVKGLADSWRSALPLLLVMAVFLVFCLSPFLNTRRRGSWRNDDK